MKARHTEYYEFLGVDPSASKEDIMKVYRKKAAQWHPDSEIFLLSCAAHLVTPREFVAFGTRLLGSIAANTSQ